MNAKLLSGWLEAPDTLGREAGAQLDALTRSFPYFQTAQLLYIKTLHNENSFLYNNQLKIAAAYASNRRMLYELITRKTPVNPTVLQPTELIEETATSTQPEAAVETTVEVAAVVDDPVPAATPSQHEPEVVQPEFPKKRFAGSDEWEAGMLRQLQLLHHWRNQPEIIKTAPVTPDEPVIETPPTSSTPIVEAEITTTELSNESPATPAATTQEPTAADEINTLLYVLAEPGDWEEELIEEEIPTEATVEEITLEEPATWEIQAVEESVETASPTVVEQEEPAVLTTAHVENPVSLPDDPVEQLILAGAVNASITQEVDDRWPSPEELLPKPKTEETPVTPVDVQFPEPAEATQDEIAPEIVPTATIESTETVDSGEISFTGWLKKLSHQAQSTEPVAETKLETPALAPEPEQEVQEEIQEPVQELIEEELPPSPEEKIPTEKQQIIDKFIREEPRIKPNKNKFYNPVNMARQSVQESDEFITETLARIYVKQGNLSKAIRAYQKLSLKFPEKSTYFAALIEELKRTPK